MEQLARRGQLSLSRTRTNGDYVRMLRSDALRSKLARLTVLFERAHYGREALDPQTLDEARALARALIEFEARA